MAASHASKAAEARYVRGIKGVLRAVHKEYQAFMFPKLKDMTLKEDARTYAHKEYSGELDLLGVHVEAQVKKTVGPLFDRMAGEVSRANAMAQAKLVGISIPDTRIAAAISHSRDENIKLVEKAARVYAEQVRDLFDGPEVYNMRHEVLQASLMDRADVSESRAELIARDQCLKLNGKITEIRQTNAGVTSYTWSTSNDERVRETHAALEGQEFDWNSPPEPGHPGEDFQCRCVAVPVIEELDRPEE